jgi:hypothetical protein
LRWDQSEVSNKRKVIWKQNAILTSRANPLPDNKAARSKIVRDKNVNANNASAKNKAAVVNKVAEVSRADDNPGGLGLTSGGRRLPPFLMSRPERRIENPRPRLFYHFEVAS